MSWLTVALCAGVFILMVYSWMVAAADPGDNDDALGDGIARQEHPHRTKKSRLDGNRDGSKHR